MYYTDGHRAPPTQRQKDKLVMRMSPLQQKLVYSTGNCSEVFRLTRTNILSHDLRLRPRPPEPKMLHDAECSSNADVPGTWPGGQRSRAGVWRQGSKSLLDWRVVPGWPLPVLLCLPLSGGNLKSHQPEEGQDMHPVIAAGPLQFQTHDFSRPQTAACFCLVPRCSCAPGPARAHGHHVPAQ